MWQYLNPFSFIVFFFLIRVLSRGVRKIFILPSPKNIRGNLFFYPLIRVICFINWWGLTPYTARLTAHIVRVFRVGLLIWGTIIRRSLFLSARQVVRNTFPGDSPAILITPLVLIETLRHIVRPITLSFRLRANITAGHIIIVLVARATTYQAPYTPLITFLPTIGYTLFEMFICFIQAYIFYMLLNLYLREYH